MHEIEPYRGLIGLRVGLSAARVAATRQPPSETIQPRKTRSRGDHATRFTTRSSGDPEVQLWAPRAAPTFGAARDLTQGVVVDSVNVSVLP